jgi:hypothetical protein
MDMVIVKINWGGKAKSDRLFTDNLLLLVENLQIAVENLANSNAIV